MNTNFIRTILNLLSGGTFMWIFTSLLGCTGDNPATIPVELSVCTASWLPVQYQAFAGIAFVGLGLLMKMFGGTAATVKQKLTAPVVPIVKADEATVGVVTPAQVNSPGNNK